jgi:hypothetical protein
MVSALIVMNHSVCSCGLLAVRKYAGTGRSLTINATMETQNQVTAAVISAQSNQDSLAL